MITMPTIVLHTSIFILLSIAARQIGKFFSKYGLPYITGYLLAGALAGPFILQILPPEATTELRYIDDMALAIIAFIAGSELYLKELRGRWRGILLNSAGIVVAALILIGSAVYFLTPYISFTADFTPVMRFAAAILGATILLALSPASTIAVIQEVRAKGPFSKTLLSITVVMDVVIIVLFAISVALATNLMDGSSMSAQFAILLVIDIAIAIGAGLLVGKGLSYIVGGKIPNILKIIALLGVGLFIFEASYLVPDWSVATFGVKLKLEPLLLAMVAGFTITNYTPYREDFEHLLHDISPAMYVAFFVLTGIGLKLDVLLSTLGIALALFSVRVGSIWLGTKIGSTLAGEAPIFRNWAWMGFITQAGIALGLARETAVEFPNNLGSSFATLIIAVVVLNEVFGPLFLKFALRKSGEIKTAGAESARKVLILGVEPQSLALSRQLVRNGWTVTLADTNADRLQNVPHEEVKLCHIADIKKPALAELINGGIEAMVAMLDDDDANLCVSRIAQEEFDIRNQIIRLNDQSRRPEVEALHARVLDPASAMVSLLHQLLRAPESVDLFLLDPTHEVTQVTVRDETLSGMPLRDLRLPTDVLVLEILRKGQAIVPHGASKLNLEDEVVLMGSPASLAQVSFKFS